VPPFLYAQICAALTAAREGAQADPAAPDEQFVLEKPFGRDVATCSQLLGQLSMLKPSATFYIDHYLGKELVMNLLVLRFANVCFGAVWNRQHIKSVQVRRAWRAHAPPSPSPPLGPAFAPAFAPAPNLGRNWLPPSRAAAACRPRPPLWWHAGALLCT